MKKQFLFLFPMLLMVLLFTNCKSDDDAQPGEPFEIDYQFQKKVTDELTISFTEVTTDSRCPCEADCITAGQIGIKIKMETNETELTKLFTLDGFDELEGAVTETEFENYKIKLLDVLPFPCNGQPGTAEDYYLEIQVTEL